MTEYLPYIQLVGLGAVLIGLGITIATIMFYGGKIVARQENDSKRIDNIEEVLFVNPNIVKLATQHEYHIDNVCDRRKERVGR